MLFSKGFARKYASGCGGNGLRSLSVAFLSAVGWRMCSSSGNGYGFQRKGFGEDPLAGSVKQYDRHLFLYYGNSRVWPSHVEAKELQHLPSFLSSAMARRKVDVKRRTLLTICEGEDSNESSNGDLLIFPDMIRYRRLTHFDVDTFVEEALVKEAEWLPGAAEPLTGSYVFVCSHGSRDRRCGVCGPAIIEKFKDEITLRGLQGQVSISPCSHIGGHKYAGNVIIYSRIDNAVVGHWYGYVSPDDVPALLEKHIGKGEILAHMWRGQMGMPKEEQKKAFQQFLLKEGAGKEKIDTPTESAGALNGNVTNAAGCCQGVANFVCCQNMEMESKEIEGNDCTLDKEVEKSVLRKSSAGADGSGGKGICFRKIHAISMWFENWEREDTFAALAVVTAVASVAVAYGCYKNLK